jgi:hypothetical protein
MFYGSPERPQIPPISNRQVGGIAAGIASGRFNRSTSDFMGDTSTKISYDDVLIGAGGAG